MDESGSNTRQMMANRAVDVGTTEALKLRSMGLVLFQGNKVVPLCKLYSQCFCVGVARRRHRLGIKN
ncbi:AAA-like domain-containing protein [Nostoc sp. FACHB-133]|uniref:AAA-like domain-containing protein n=1 Tax=Nostoc sp. FACHB-133 TaxID=2692835 RepID=UPI0028C4CB2D|nr:AAA-like domain-containing protein [Nostoc sp. FACHB-133]